MGLGWGVVVGREGVVRIATYTVHRHRAARHRDGVLACVNQLVALPQVVAVRGLVQHVVDNAVELRAECVVRGLVRKAPRGQQGHGELLAVKGARHVVQGAGIVGVQLLRHRRGGWWGWVWFARGVDLKNAPHAWSSEQLRRDSPLRPKYHKGPGRQRQRIVRRRKTSFWVYG